MARRQANKQKAFTIIELLTVMSIIVVLIGLLVPALQRVRRYAKRVEQSAQFHSIEAALELFNNEFEGYPDSGRIDNSPNGQAYGGAMKLGEAMMGQDMLGFHADSVFRADGLDINGNTNFPLYPRQNPPTNANLKLRRGPFLPPESANAFRIGDIYQGAVQPFDPCSIVLCDVFERTAHETTGQKIGMPVLYYKGDTGKNLHDVTNPENLNNIYNFWDNQDLLALGKPDMQNFQHILHTDTTPGSSAGSQPGARFYWNARSNKINSTVDRPFRADSYILISAGFDGEYGTADDLCNFDWKFMQ